MNMGFLNVMLFILGVIGVVILLLSIWFAISLGVESMEDITFKFNLLSFLTGVSYILFAVIVLKLVKRGVIH